MKSKIPPALLAFVFPLLLGGLLLLAGCGKEEKPQATATPVKAAAAGPAATSAPAPTKAAEATKPAAAPTAALAGLPPNIDKLSPKLSGYLRKYYPNDPNVMKPDGKDVKPKYGGEISGPGATPPNWDFYNQTDVNIRYQGPLIYSTFVRPAVNRGDNLVTVQAKPDMAESWEQAKDGMSWTFKMRKGMKWQNRPPVNGRPVTIQDMKYGLDLLRTSPVSKGDFTDIQDTVVVDDTTLKVVLNKPAPDMIKLLMSIYAMIMPKECFESQDCRENKPVGSGPFMFDSMQARVQITLVKNPDYYGTDAQGNKLPFLDKINTIVFADPAASLAAFRTGKIDSQQLYGERDYLDIMKSNPDTIVMLGGPITDNTMHGTAIHFKYQDGKPWMDPKVRLAMSLATDRNALCNTAWDGLCSPMQPVPFYQMGMSYYPSLDQLGPAFQYDVEKAKKLLAEAGYAKGFKAKILNSGTTGPSWNTILIWQQMLQKVGIELEIVTAPDSTAYYGQWMKNQFEDLVYQPLINMTWTRPSLAAYNTLHSKGSVNFEKLSDPKLDEMLDKARDTTDPDARAKILKQVMDYEGENPHVIYGVAPYHFDVMSARTHRLAAGDGYHIWGYMMRSLIETWVDK